MLWDGEMRARDDDGVRKGQNTHQEQQHKEECERTQSVDKIVLHFHLNYEYKYCSYTFRNWIFHLIQKIKLLFC